MTESQIQELFADSGGKRLCTRFYRRADGTVLTQDCPWSLRVLTRKVSRLAAALLTAIMGASVAMARNKPRPPTCECSQSQQKDSGIKLIVVDQHGAVIPKAEITLERKPGNAAAVMGMTGPSGGWSAAQLTAGRYRVTIKSQGFSTFSSVVDVQDRRLLTLVVKLPVAAVSTTVEVTANSLVMQGVTIGVTTSTQNSAAFPILNSGGQRSPMRP
ncbi:MAG TPA: carboxypeptidase-like regulatory domain-containing protein [Candidatus Angelobacter sp.]|nr:carboxypeptidase-like regulatory domain-containing protein [Candidatus Angelobacter sp.]